MPQFGSTWDNDCKQTFASCNIFLGNFFKCVFFQVALMISVGQYCAVPLSADMVCRWLLGMVDLFAYILSHNIIHVVTMRLVFY